ncbi:MAG: ATP-binding cassette domain-containing protein [Spirochaetes bacterium]|nr:ATP-binding cassette domain-containing protein [Spirochaetota bacterium]
MGRTEETVIEASHIHKSYGRVRAVRDMSFDLKRAVCLGFLGPNGAGKTTMMNLVYGKAVRDDRPESTLKVFGKDPAGHELEIKYLSGVVPQENNLDVELNVRQNLLIYSKFYGIPKSEANARIDSLLEFMELSDKTGAKIRELSGGMKRRLIIVRALLNDPRLLILDEPTTGLDPQVRHLIWDKIRQLKNGGTTILLTTHYMEEAFQIADRIIIMNQGVKMIEGNPKELLQSQMERYVLEVKNPERFERIDRLVTGGVRKDSSAGVVLLYSDDPNALKLLAGRLGPGDYHTRETNLEDLFLKLTGRDLHE